MDQRKYMIQVRDTGVGIPQSEIPNLFEAFTKIDYERNLNK